MAAVATGAAFAVGRLVVPNILVLIATCILPWLGYVSMRARSDRQVLLAWGLRVDNLRAASAFPTVLAIGTVIAITGYRLWAGYRPLPGTALLIFALYPLWALFQQLFVQSLIAGNLQRLGLHRGAVIAIAALLFGAVHLPDTTLALMCTVAGAVWTACYLAVPNILPLAFAHGIVGTLAYYWVLERNPLGG
jgi:hypothetical protein